MALIAGIRTDFVKPPSWNISPFLTAAPELWNGTKVLLPLIEQLPDKLTKTYDYAARVFRSVPLNSSFLSPLITKYGFALDNNTAIEKQIDLPNVIGGRNEFTILFIGTPKSTTSDQTIVGRWNTNNTIVFHFDDNDKIRFLLNPGTVGDWTADTYAADGTYLIAGRLKPNGEMSVFINGSKNIVRAAGSPLTVDAGAPKLGFFDDDGGSTNGPFDGAVIFLSISEIAFSDALIRSWTRDPFAMIRMADEVGVVIGLPAVGVVGVGQYPVMVYG